MGKMIQIKKKINGTGYEICIAGNYEPYFIKIPRKNYTYNRDMSFQTLTFGKCMVLPYLCVVKRANIYNLLLMQKGQIKIHYCNGKPIKYTNNDDTNYIKLYKDDILTGIFMTTIGLSIVVMLCKLLK